MQHSDAPVSTSACISVIPGVGTAGGPVKLGSNPTLTIKVGPQAAKRSAPETPGELSKPHFVSGIRGSVHY